MLRLKHPRMPIAPFLSVVLVLLVGYLPLADVSGEVVRLLAFWNAPDPQPDHAGRAMLAIGTSWVVPTGRCQNRFGSGSASTPVLPSWAISACPAASATRSWETQ